MRLLYISFWSIESGLTHATIFPVLKYLIAEGLVESITLASPESKHNDVEFEGLEGVTWLPVYTSKRNVNESGFWQILTLLRGVGNHLRKNRKTYDMLWARGSVAGGVASLLSKAFSIPFGVESFEPHSDYMVESGAWPKGGNKFLIQKQQEAREMKNASVLITVSSRYTDLLIEKGISNVFTIPCSLDFDDMVYDPEERNLIREEIPGITNDSLIGIYVGKFGDIYYDDIFFDYMQSIIDGDPNYFQIILTPMVDHANRMMEERGIRSQRYIVKQVPHSEVASYLSASDIAFCPVKQTPSKKFCSPVKTGEYLAAGLPIIISKDISDDSDFIARNAIGQVVDFENRKERSAPDLNGIISKTTRDQVRELGSQYRDAQHNFQVYNEVFSRLS